jgi:hypothetical protein
LWLFFLLVFFFVLVEALSLLFLVAEPPLAESLSDDPEPVESESLESVSSESLSDDPVLLFRALFEPGRPERDARADESLSLLPRLSLAESVASSSALVECDDELLPCP